MFVLIIIIIWKKKITKILKKKIEIRFFVIELNRKVQIYVKNYKFINIGK